MTDALRATPTPPDQETDPGPRAALVFLVTALGSFVAALDLSIVNVAFPDLSASYPEASPAHLSWVLTSYTIVFGALLVVGGRTGDRIGRKHTFFIGLGVFMVGSLLCGLAPSVGFLIASRALQGAGAALLVPTSLALLIAAYPRERRTQTVALWGGVGALAVATGPSLGAVIVSLGGWQWAFFVNLPVGVLIALLGSRVLVESVPDSHVARLDYPGAVLITATVGALVFGIAQGTEWGWGDPRILTAFAVTILAGTWFVVRSLHHPEPVLDLGLFRDRTFLYANSALFVFSTGFFGVLLGNILFLTEVWGWSILYAGLAVTPGPIVVAIVSGPAGKLAARIGFRPLLIAGAIAYSVGLLWFIARIDTTPDFLGTWLFGSLITGLGVGLTLPILSAAAVSQLPPDRYSVGSAVNQTARQVGGAIGIAVLVAILGTSSGPESLASFDHLWGYAAITALLSGLIGSFAPATPRT